MVHTKQAKSILNKHKKRDNWFLDEYSVNPYEGCSCNCLYCYVRGSRYGENMDAGLAIKENALEVLEKQLIRRAKAGEYGIVAVGTSTDAYIHHEEKWKLTEGMLQLLLKYRFPVFISTKCDLIKRDFELLKAIDKAAILPDDLKHRLARGVILSVSVSTMNEKITSFLEPGAVPPLQRLNLLQEFKQQGFLAGVNAMPLLPFISDTQEELEKIIQAASLHGADYILPAGLTLFGTGAADSKTLYYRFLEKYDPSLIAAYNNLYCNNSSAPWQYQQQLKQRANAICKKYHLRTSILQEQ
ncbi:MAG: hypothetical protein QM726_07780 [Chitinophagaceae bacterium]